jgi:hypothetical protein
LGELRPVRDFFRKKGADVTSGGFVFRAAVFFP